MTMGFKVFILFLFIFPSLFVFSQEVEIDNYLKEAEDAFAKRNYQETIRLATESLHFIGGKKGKESVEYATCLAQLSHYHQRFGNHNEAIRLQREALQIREKIWGKNHLDCAASYSSLAMSYEALFDFASAVRLETEALKIREELLGKEDFLCILTLIRISAYYDALGNYSNAISTGLDALYRLENGSTTVIPTNENPFFGIFMMKISEYYLNLGNYSDALRYCNKAISINEHIYGKKHDIYATSLLRLSQCYRFYDTKKAIYYANKALRFHKKAYSGVKNRTWEKYTHQDAKEYASKLLFLSVLYSDMGKTSKAIKLATKSLRITDNIGDRQNPLSSAIRGNLGVYFYEVKNFPYAIHNELKALQIEENTIGRHHPDYLISLKHLATFYLANHNIPEALKCFEEVFLLKRYMILRESQGLASCDKSIYWGSQKVFFEKNCPLNSYIYRDPKFHSLSYNSALLSKGFLLQTEMETKRIVEESNDSDLITLNDSLKSNLQILDAQLKKPIKERFLNTDSLERTIYRMERELAHKSAEYGSYLANRSIEWKDVQKKLKSNDIAIEFVSFQLNEDSTMYAALTLKSGYDAPKFIPLFEEKQLKEMRHLIYDNDTIGYNLVWKPLEEELEGVKNVYFSPSGELYNTNIEVLPQIAQLKEERRYYRLSSTRELALQRVEAKNEKKSAAVYGGLKYDSTVDSLISDSRKYPRKRNRSVEDFDLCVDSIHQRSGFRYLEGTLLEAQKVDSSAVSAKMESRLYTDFLGTEASFKALDGEGKQLIHIATHGFYYPERDSVQMRDEGFLVLQNEKRQRYVEDKALTRSGLLFAGCNNILNKDTLPEYVDDGVLYAKEIARLDLRGLDLLTLSACQTGCGDITGEGVFGLQRAFKKAGAQSILMSLWKVDDDATQMFMTRFYENYLIKKMSKSDALLDAQQHLRSKNEKDWAAFILLDAGETK